MNPGKTLRLLWRAALSDRSRRFFPYKLTFAATGRCNLRCVSCRVWEGGRDGMPLPWIREFFERSNRFSWIDVTGGEIFLREDLLDLFATILHRCRELAVLHFPTNGFLVDRIVETTRELTRMRPPRLVVTVSVDGPPRIHDALRGAEGSFDRAVECYARLREISGCTVVLGMTLADANMGTVGETLSTIRRRLPRRAPTALHVNLPGRSDHYYRNGDVSLPRREDLVREVRALLRSRPFSVNPIDLLERRYLAFSERYLRTGKCPVRCQALSATCFVDAQGTVFPCLTWNRPLARLDEIGFDLETLWDAAPTAKIREEVRTGRCPGCWTPCEAVPAMAAAWMELPA